MSEARELVEAILVGRHEDSRVLDNSGLAMIKGEVLGKSGNYKNLEAEYEYNT